MIDAELRRSVALLAASGMSGREISVRLGVSRNTVAAIVAQGGAMPRLVRTPKIQLDEDLLARLYAECDGYAQRVHERLVEEHRVEVSYATLTRRLRALGISTPPTRRAAHVDDVPGAEMQHDTSPYKIGIGGARTSVIASVLYLRYSKRRYLRFYRRFTRFHMKCFFHEALTHWGCAAPVCIIDNTNLARLSGSGKNARMTPEMEAFGRRYGFRFACHAIGHADRKAGEERSFRTVETNFFPGRIFETFEDLNQQAFIWATERMEARAQTKARIVPAVAFLEEKPYLVAVPDALPAPYLVHARAIDQYGYVAFDRNYYWVPGELRGEAKVLEYADRIEICQGRELACSYARPAVGVRNRRFTPEGMPKPTHGPRNCKRPTAEEEARLRALSPSVGAYLDATLAPRGIQRHGYVRRLYGMSRRMTTELFVRSVERALRYGVRDLETLERIAQLHMTAGEAPVQPVEFDARYRDRDAYRMTAGEAPVQPVEFDARYRDRDAYREGELADRPDLTRYDGEKTKE